MTAARDNQRWCVADLVVDVAAGTVHREDVEVVLPRRSFELLVALLGAAPGIASHERLLDEVWPGVVVNEETVKQRVRLLREALGDSSSAPRYVASVRGRGYRLAAEARPCGAVAAPAGAGAAGPARTVAAARRFLAFAAAFVFAAVLVATWTVFPGAPPVADGGRTRLAVLPLDFFGDEANDWFAAGLHDEIIGQLARRPDLLVTSRTSVTPYRDRMATVRQIAAELEVDAVLEGSVRRDAERIRVTMQLIDPRQDAPLWSASYDRDLGIEGILQIQREVALEVAHRLAGPSPVEDSFAVRIPTASLQAYERQLAARFLLWRVNATNLERARELFAEAVAIDPYYVEAWEGLGWAWAFLATSYGDRAPREAYPQAIEAAQRALALDPGHVGSRSLLLHARHWYEWDGAAAEAGLRELTRAHPTYLGGYLGLSYLLSGQGRHGEAIDVIEQAVALQPRDPWVLTNAGWRHAHGGQTERAESYAASALAIDPGNRDALELRATLALLQRRYAECAEREAALGNRAARAVCLALDGDGAAARALIAELERRYGERYTSAWSIARLAAAVGDTDRAFRWLGHAIEDRQREVLFMDISPVFAGLRDDPRYARLLELTGQHREATATAHAG